MPLCLACGSEALVDGPKKGEWLYRRCTRCGLLSSHPLPSPAQIESHYRSKFEQGNYELIRRYASQYRRVHSQLADWIEFRPGDRILDVGCFTGDLLTILAERGADVYGLELQPEAVAIAKEHLGERVQQADVQGADFPAGPYDVVTMMGLIEHVLDPEAFVRRAHELLAKNGRIYFQTPNAGSLLARAFGAAWPPLAPIEHIHIFSAKALRALLERENFTNVHIRAHVKWLPVSYVYEQFANFGGPAWQRVLVPFKTLFGDVRLPFYGGEMFVTARRG